MVEKGFSPLPDTKLPKNIPHQPSTLLREAQDKLLRLTFCLSGNDLFAKYKTSQKYCQQRNRDFDKRVFVCVRRVHFSVSAVFLYFRLLERGGTQ